MFFIQTSKLPQARTEHLRDIESMVCKSTNSQTKVMLELEDNSNIIYYIWNFQRLLILEKFRYFIKENDSDKCSEALRFEKDVVGGLLTSPVLAMEVRHWWCRNWGWSISPKARWRWTEQPKFPSNRWTRGFPTDSSPQVAESTAPSKPSQAVTAFPLRIFSWKLSIE